MSEKSKEIQKYLLENQNRPPKFEVGLHPIALDAWLLPDDQSESLLRKNWLLDNSLYEVFAQTNHSISAQKEVFELITQLGLSSAKIDNSNEPYLVRAGRLVSDDLIIMSKMGEHWQVSAAILCSPTFFDAKHAIGKSVSLLHGPIPTGSFDLSARIERVFDNMATDLVMERHNWTVQWGGERYTPNGQKLRDMANSASINDAKQMVFERVERQTIRKLPQSGAILFTIRVRLENLWDIIQDENARAAFVNAWNNAPDEVKTYKKWAHLERHIDAILGD